LARDEGAADPLPPQGSIYHKRRDTANGPRPVQHNHPMQGRRAGQRAIASWGDQGGVTRSGPFPPPFRDGLRSRRMAESREKTGELGDVMLRSGGMARTGIAESILLIAG
jgi:hypothetical protein